MLSANEDVTDFYGSSFAYLLFRYVDWLIQNYPRNLHGDEKFIVRDCLEERYFEILTVSWHAGDVVEPS